MSIADILPERPFLCVSFSDGRQWQRVLYDTDAFSLMHAAQRMDRWLLSNVGFVPQDRVWWVQPARASNGI